MKTKNIFLLACAGFVLAGCTQVYVSPRQESLPAEKSPINQNTQVNNNAFSIDSEVITKIRVKVFSDKSEESFCKKLSQRIASSMLSENSEIVTVDPYDISIFLNPEFELFDKDGEYFRVDCRQITATIRSARKIYASKTIELKPMQRKISLARAKEQYLNPAAAELAPFISNELAKIAQSEIGVSEIKFNLANIREKADSADIAYQVDRISRILSSTSGILNYSVIEQNINKASCTFRVVYLKDNVREGLTNVLNIKLMK